MRAAKIKPCPFGCSPTASSPYPSYFIGEVRIKCALCGALGPVVHYDRADGDGQIKGAKKAAELWNEAPREAKP